MLGVQGEEPEGQHKRSGHASEAQVGRTDEDLVVLDDLGLGKGDLEMRVVELAGGVFAALDVGHVVAHLLDLLAMDVAVVLGGDDVRDLALLGLEVVFDFAGVVVGVGLDEDGVAVQSPVGVGHAAGIQLAVLEVDFDVVGAELHVLVLHHGAAEEVGVAALQVVDHGILCAVLHRGGDGVGGDDLRTWEGRVGRSRIIRVGNFAHQGVRWGLDRPAAPGVLTRRREAQHTEYECHKQHP